MLSRDSEDEMWSRFMFELLIWLQEATLARWTQSSGPLCLWQCFFNVDMLVFWHPFEEISAEGRGGCSPIHNCFFSVKGGGVVPRRDKHLQYLTTSPLIGNNMNWSPFAFCFHRGLKWCMLWRRYCNRFAIRSPRSGARPLVARFEVVRHDSSNLSELFF